MTEGDACVAGGFAEPVDGGSLRVVLLGGFSLGGDGGVRRVPLSAQRLLAFVALQERPVSRARAAFALWPEVSDAHAYGSLRSALFRLRVSRLEGSLVDRGGEFELCAGVGVDVRRARVLVTRLTAGLDALADGGAELESLLMSGELLSDWYDDWALVERERFNELRLQGLDILCASYLESGDRVRALSCGRAAVEVDELRESSRRTLIRVLLAEGNTAEAFEQQRQFAKLLEPLGLAPSPQLGELLHDPARR